MKQHSLIFVLVSIRSLYNVGALFRTADGLGATKIFLTGFTGTPKQPKLKKTALGADESVAWEYVKSASTVIRQLKEAHYEIVGLEKTKESTDFREWNPKKKTAILLGNEERGLSPRILKQCDEIIHLPMLGIKESLNVTTAAGAMGYHWLSKQEE